MNSPLGIPAGPLLNSRWIHYYAALGFDVLTYKTVRSSARSCYALPNLQPVESVSLSDEGEVLRVSESAKFDSWAISFGMPSKAPLIWRKDVEIARAGLSKGQVLVVSVVASPQTDWTMEEVAEDFAKCAAWAAESGADVVEPNLSCPNVCTQEADLYLSGDASRLVAQAVRAAVGRLPVVLKVGLFPNQAKAEELVDAVAPFADAISATNSITGRVSAADGTLLFDGLRRGIGGAAIEQRCLDEVRMLSAIVKKRKSQLQLIGVGGASTVAHVRKRLEAGAHHVQLATAAMLDPNVALKIRQELASTK